MGHLTLSPLARWTGAFLLAIEGLIFAILGWGAHVLPPGNAPWYSLLFGDRPVDSLVERVVVVGPYFVAAPFYVVSLMALLRTPASPRSIEKVALAGVAFVNFGAMLYWIEDMLWYYRTLGLTAWDMGGYALTFAWFALLAGLALIVAFGTDRAR